MQSGPDFRATATVAFACFALTLGSCSRSASSYRDAGDRLLSEGKFADAALDYRKFLQKEPGSAEALYGLGVAELNQGNLTLARQALARSVALKPNYRDAMSHLADVCLVQYVENPSRPAALYQQASEIAKQLTELGPDEFHAVRLRGQIALVDGHADQAVELLLKAHHLKPLDRRVTLPLVQSLLLTSRLDEAEKVARTTLSKDPGFVQLYDLLYRYYVSANRQGNAESILKQKVLAHPDHADFRIELAAFYAVGNQSAEARDALNPLFVRLKEYPDAHLRIADMYLRFAKGNDAKRHLEEGLRSDPPRKVAYLKRLGALAWAENDRKKAIEYSRAAVEAAPDDEEARRYRGSFLLDAGSKDDLETVIDDYTKLLKNSPKDKVLHNQLGKAYRSKGNSVLAWKHFQHASQGSANYLAPRLSLAELSSEQRNNEQALRYLDEILAIDKNNPAVRLFRASTLRKMNRLSEARREIQSLVSSDSKNRDFRIEYGLLNLSEGRPREAEAIFTQLSHTEALDARSIVGLAEAYALQKQFSKALALLEAEIKKAPHDVGPRIALARMTARSGNADGAIEQYRQLIAANPKVALYHLESAQVLLAAGSSLEALESLRKAVTIAPNDAYVIYSLATGLHVAGRLDEARRQYEKALVLDPDNLDLLNNLAFLSAEQGRDLDRGIELARKALSQAPNNASYSDTLSLLYIKRNDPDQALRLLRPLSSKNPDNTAFRLHLAMALSMKGSRDEAKRELQNALARRPSASESVAIRELLTKLELQNGKSN